MQRFLMMLLVVALAGCATARKDNKDIQIQRLQMEVNQLKGEIQKKEAKIESLEGRLAKSQEEKISFTREKNTKLLESNVTKMSPKNIQIALKNAGFYNGPVDGKIGKMTKAAIRDFQRTNGLAVDGIVGKQTWLKLSKYIK